MEFAHLLTIGIRLVVRLTLPKWVVPRLQIAECPYVQQSLIYSRHVTLSFTMSCKAIDTLRRRP